MNDLRVKKAVTEVDMRETNIGSCPGICFFAKSDKHSAEEMSGAINGHLEAVRGQI